MINMSQFDPRDILLTVEVSCLRSRGGGGEITVLSYMKLLNRVERNKNKSKISMRQKTKERWQKRKTSLPWNGI